ncbi:MAG: SAM hydrolase/SAM-dependent halogenase family protein [Bacteroidota bacterium]
MNHPIITLTTDWGTRDFYVGAVKGKLLQKIPSANIIDISHHIAPHDIIHASFVLKNILSCYPENTIHIIGVDTNESSDTPHAIVKWHNQYFIGTDNGIFSLISEEHPEEIIHLDIHQESDYFTFPARDLFCKAAALLTEGHSLDSLGYEATSLKKLQTFQPVVSENMIRAKVIHIDRYKNLITNIHHQTFNNVGKNKAFELHFHNKQYNIEKLHTSYNEVNEAEMMALFGTSGFLEIALNRGKASELLGMGLDSPVIVEFKE